MKKLLILLLFVSLLLSSCARCSRESGQADDPDPALQARARLARQGGPVATVQGGSFDMGSSTGEVGRNANETQRRVTLSPFNLSVTLVTQSEYEEVMGTNPSHFRGPNLPVENISWFDAIEYCNRLSQRDGRTPAYTITGSGNSRNVTWNQNVNGYRLPTEAEWEFACRAGTTTPFSAGDNITTDEANYNGSFPYNENERGVNRQRTTEVGSFDPNPWGFYDMHGNVWEWCWDRFGNFTTEAQTNPIGAASGSARVVRGGSWFDGADHLRSSNRDDAPPSRRRSTIGFRIVIP